MKYLSLVLTLIFLQSCGSGATKPSSDGDYNGEVGEFANADFNSPAAEYDSGDDEFKTVKGDVLSKESISRVPKARLMNLNFSDNPISDGVRLCYSKKFKRGLSLLDKSYRKFRKHPSYWNQLGTCYLLKGNYRKALIYYNKSLETDKSYAPPYNNIGVIHMKLGDDQKALVTFEKAAELNPYSLTPIFNMANIYLEYGLIDDALRFFTILYKKEKSDVDVTNGYATSLLFKAKYEQAVEAYSQIPDQFLGKPQYGLNYAVALNAQGKDKRAKRAFIKIRNSSLKEWKGYYSKVGKYLGVL